jgi:hypothetical protein
MTRQMPTGSAPEFGPNVLNNLQFKDVDGKTLILIGVPLTMTTREVKQRLGREKAIDTTSYRFIYSGKQFENGTVDSLMAHSGN